MTGETHLVRTTGGGMVHRRGCPFAKRGKPWEWAEGLTRDAILAGTAGLGVRFCRRCRPLYDLPADLGYPPYFESALDGSS